MTTSHRGLERETFTYEFIPKPTVEPKTPASPKPSPIPNPMPPPPSLPSAAAPLSTPPNSMNLCTNPLLPRLPPSRPTAKASPSPNPPPLLAVPTTAGTGSETTGTAIFDLVAAKTKTGIAHRALKPTIGICDPINTRTMPSAVHASSGLDAANPISDIFLPPSPPLHNQIPPRAVRDPDDHEAQSEMLLAATLAGVGFGNAGVHLCHGMSYPISAPKPVRI
ncbi:hypothetical protein ABVK25_012284 [Lepraria finkii]|uniref:Uncharacterized protein n=1 Tax=Lepraria finkii TaxID=1340010 RepID=A0ABR4AGS1_9LECA